MSDLISRQAVLDGIAEWIVSGYADSEADCSHISSLVTHLPSVENKGDLISRQAVLNTLDNMDKALDEERTVEKYKELLTECIKVLPSAENKGEWIPVSERLPKERQAVLCWAKSTAERLDAEFIGMYDTGDWFLQSDANHLSFPHQYNVVAWMPLPSPWKGE